MMASVSTSSASSSVSTQTLSGKRIPKSIAELLDLAVYSFSCQSGLRSEHKIRGDPVLEGVSAFFGRLILTANTETQTVFQDITPSRLGNWQPESAPTKELLTLISSRMKSLKAKSAIREQSNPEVPTILLKKVENYVEEEDRVITRTYAKCWRCARRCQFCLAKKKHFPKFGNFNVDIASPFLDVLEDMLGDDDVTSEEEEDEDMMDMDEEDSNHQNMLQCISNSDFPDDEEDSTIDTEGRESVRSDLSSEVVEELSEDETADS